MISTFKKYWSRLKIKVCPALLLIFLISCIASPFASAADYNGYGEVQLTHFFNGTSTYNTIVLKSGNLPFVNVEGQVGSGYMSGKTGTYMIPKISIGTSSDIYTSPVTLYFSCFAYFAFPNVAYNIGDRLTSNPFKAFYVDSSTDIRVDIDTRDYSSFTPDFVNPYPVFPGAVVSATFDASTEQPITLPTIYTPDFFYYWSQYDSSNSNVPVMRVVSFRAVATATTAELEGLEAIADSIVAQSQMMQAFYGDIVAVCNQIYSRLGDMQQTAELANIYFSQMITLLQNIDRNVVNIYNLLPSQFAMLESAIDTASTDIVAAVQAQTNALIAYFDSVFSGAVGTLPDKSEDLETEIGNVGDAESQYKSNASATFEQLSTDFTGFTGGTLSGIALASNLFTQVWNALGEYSVVYSFPLLFGLCLLLIGRLSKHSGGQSSTDKERGDSDA